MPRLPGSQYCWCFTLNNYSEEEYNHAVEISELQSKYWIIGKEIGDSGTPHLQGYISLRRRRNLGGLRDLYSSRYHFEAARGTARQNREYCSKSGSFREGGDIPSSGKPKPKSRDELAREFVSSYRTGNSGLAEFASSNPGTFYYSGYNLLRNTQLIIQPIHRPNIQVKWIWGDPGTGKSRTAHEELPEAYLKEPRTKWWNGYMHEKSVIIDDFGPCGIDLNHLLRWFDRYKCLVETKGGMISLHADTFIVTSNFEPSDCFKDKDGIPHPQMEALYRRIEIINM